MECMHFIFLSLVVDIAQVQTKKGKWNGKKKIKRKLNAMPFCTIIFIFTTIWFSSYACTAWHSSLEQLMVLFSYNFADVYIVFVYTSNTINAFVVFVIN